MKLPASLLLLFVLTIGAFFPSCRRDQSVELETVRKGLQASIVVTGDYLTEIGVDSTIRTYSISYEILDSTESFGHGFGLRVLKGPPYDLDSCNCDSLIYCVTLAFPIQQVQQAGFRNLNTPIDEIYAVENGIGGYIDYTDPRPPANTQVNTNLKVCAAQDSNRIVFFEMGIGFPPGFDLREAINKVEGICIVENVCDTNPDADTQALGGPDDILDDG